MWVRTREAAVSNVKVRINVSPLRKEEGMNSRDIVELEFIGFGN